MSKSLMMYGADGAGVLASSSNQMVFVIFFAMLIYGTWNGTHFSFILFTILYIFELQGDLEHFPDVGSLDDNVESFLSHDDADARDIFSALKASPAEHKSELTKGDYSHEESLV